VFRRTGARPVVGFDYSIERRVGNGPVFGHHGGDGLPDAGEAEATIEEGGDGDLVGGVEHGGEGAPGFACLPSQGERWKDGGEPRIPAGQVAQNPAGAGCWERGRAR